jgi:tRNA pseudouridine55 synthase
MEGVTSFQALGQIKKALGTRKVGHCGTLDRFASGALIVVAGRYTRLASRFEAMGKRYIASFSFGSRTDTLDPEGEVVARGPLPSRSDVEKALPLFLGKIAQIPPEYSAVHVDGERAYKIALRGDTPELKSREVSIEAFDLVRHEGGTFTFDIKCSKGTYIRSLARDLARAIGSEAYVSSLRRVAVGPFSLDLVRPDTDALPIEQRITPELAVKAGWRPVIVQDPTRFLSGRPLDVRDFDSGVGMYAAFDIEGRLLGLVSKRADALSYEAVLA